MESHVFAMQFNTALSLNEMVVRLQNAIPRWKWIEWQNDRWGDYIRGIAKTQGDASIKILYDDEIGRWAINVNHDGHSAGEMRAFVEGQILPSIDAVNASLLSEDYSS
jgi:hypothetical protein